MAKKNRRLGKISLTIILTILIWVWADLSQDEERTLTNLVALDLAQPSDETLWVSFVGTDGTLNSTAILDSVTLKGPASQIAEIDRTRKKGLLNLNLVVIPEDEGLTEVGDALTFNVLDFLRDSTEIRDLGLTVELCEPAILTVQVRRLVEKTVPVQCVDEDGVVLDAKIEPPDVTTYVPSDGIYIATVRLSSREREQARNADITKTPYIELAADQRRTVATDVEVTLAREQMTLGEHKVEARWVYCFSPVLQGKYRVELDPQSRTDLANIRVKATPDAFAAYQNETIHIFVFVLDSDKETMTVRDREVIFNFPDEYVRRGEIEAAVHPKASFKLVPITTGVAAPPP